MINVNSPSLNKRLKLKIIKPKVEEESVGEVEADKLDIPKTKNVKWKKTREFLQNILNKDEFDTKIRIAKKSKRKSSIAGQSGGKP